MYKSTNTSTNHPQPLYSLLSIVVPPPNDRDLSSHLQRIFFGNSKKIILWLILVSYIHQSFSQVVVCIEERLPSFVNQIDVPKLLTETCNWGSLHWSLQKVLRSLYFVQGKSTCEGLQSCFSTFAVPQHRVCAPSAARLCLGKKNSFRQGKLSLFEILTFFHFFEFSYWILFSYLVGSLLVSKALWYFSSPEREKLFYVKFYGFQSN